MVFKEKPLPNFIHFGTPKSGSGTLSYYLSRHPQIYTPRPKELNFFNSERDYTKGIAWYWDAYFSDYAGEPILCDKSIGYACGKPERTMERIISTLGNDFRILLTVRNPIDRAYSQYCMARYKGQIDNDGFTHAIQSALKVRGQYSDQDLQRAVYDQGYYRSEHDMAIYRDAMYLVPGHYAHLLDLCQAAVGPQNVVLLFTEDMNVDLPGAVRKVTDFLSIDAIEVDPSLRQNEATTLRFPGLRRTYNKLYSWPPVQKAYKSLSAAARRSIRRKLLSWNYRPNNSIPPMAVEARALLAEHYAADVSEFQRMTGRNLSHWLNPGTGDAAK